MRHLKSYDESIKDYILSGLIFLSSCNLKYHSWITDKNGTDIDPKRFYDTSIEVKVIEKDYIEGSKPNPLLPPDNPTNLFKFKDKNGNKFVLRVPFLGDDNDVKDGDIVFLEVDSNGRADIYKRFEKYPK